MTLLKQPEPVYGKHPDTGYNALPPVYQVDPNEMIQGLLELNLTAPDSQSVRRYQVIILRRAQDERIEGDQGKRQFIADMGLASLWGVDQIHIPCEWIKSAAVAMDVADQIRQMDMKKRLSLEPEDLYNGYFDMVEERIRDASHVSQFGPLYKVQR